MRSKKENYLIIAFAAILLFFVFYIVFLAFNASQTPPLQQEPSPSPTLEPTVTEERPLVPPPVHYDDNAQQSLLEKIEQRKPPSAEDEVAIAKIFALLPSGEKSGVLHQTPNIIIDYVSSADVFQVEILTLKFEEAKAEANIWFRSQGMSQDMICNYPVQFYLNFDIAEQLRDKNITFNPLAPNCK